MDADRVVTDMAARRLGLVVRQEAQVAGLSDGAVDARLRAGRWDRLHRNVYGVAGAPATWERALLAAVTAAGPDAAVSHRSAALLWGIGRFGGSPVEITVPNPRSPDLSGVIVHRSRDLAPEWVTTIRGIPVTTPVRTLVDLGQVVRSWIVERAFHDAHGKKLITYEGAVAALHRLGRKGRRGAGAFRAIVEQLSGVDPAGWLEGELGRLLDALGVPTPVPELEIFHNGEFAGRADYTIVEVKLCLEGNGFESHGTFEGFTKDHVRRNALLLAGYGVLEFTHNHVVNEHQYVAHTVARAYRARLPLFS